MCERCKGDEAQLGALKLATEKGREEREEGKGLIQLTHYREREEKDSVAVWQNCSH